MSRLAALALLALVGSLALLGAGCGGNGDDATDATPTDEWAESFCTAVSSWTDELRRIGDTIDDPSALDPDTLRAAADDVSATTESFVDDVRALGTPDTESGEEIRDSLDTLSDTLETERADIEAAIEDISTLADIPAAITTIGASVSAMGSAFQTALDAVDDADVGGELESALEQSDACDEIVG
jgi:hypothetical protein